jgi:ankyrin repeat protein
LLKAGAEIDMRDEFGPPVCWAARGGHAGIVSKLVASDLAFLAEMNRVGQRALGLAAMRGHAETVRTLVKAGAKVDAPSYLTEHDKCWDFTPLMHAARAGHAGVVEILIEAKANVHTKLENHSGQYDIREGMNALMIAAEYGRADVVRLLIKAGCNVNEMRKDEATGPLWLASMRGYDADTVKTLLDAGARRNYLDNKPGRIPLLAYAASYAPAKVMEALLQDGERADWRDSRGYSSLAHMASYSQRAENVAILVRHGADIESTDDRGNTPLMNAAGRGAGPMVQALLDAGAKVNESNRQMYQSGSSHYKNYYYGFTPLMCAVSDGHTAIARTLLRAGANVNALGGDGSTALILAVRGKHLNSVRLLLEAGADCKPKCFDETAYSIASKNGSHEIAVLLQKYM